MLDRVAVLLPLLAVLRLLRSREPALAPAPPGQRLAAALHALGPSFIKLGQLLSTPADLLSEQFAADISQLQHRLPPFPAPFARLIASAEFAQPLLAIFS